MECTPLDGDELKARERGIVITIAKIERPQRASKITAGYVQIFSPIERRIWPIIVEIDAIIGTDRTTSENKMAPKTILFNIGV